MPHSSAMIAKELDRRVHGSGGGPAASASGDEHDDADEAPRLRAALSDLVDATLDEELTAQAREAVNASTCNVGEASTASDGVQSLAERAADEIVENSATYHMLQDAVREAAATARTNTVSADTKCEHKDAAASSGHKKAKRDADTDACGDYRINAIADEAWGAHGDDDHKNDDPFAASFNASTTGTANADAGAVKSFSLFDMLDSQPGMGFGAERVSAQQILSAFGGTNGDGNDDVTTTMEDDSDARYNEAASLLERVDDLEDLLFDPFGDSGGDVWPDINRVLRSGLGLGDTGGKGDDASAPTATAETPPSPDVIVRYAHIHSKLDGLCGSSSSSSGIDFGHQRIALVINMADAVVVRYSQLEFKWCFVKESGEVYMAEEVGTLVQIMLDMIISSAPALELALEEDCHRFLLGIMKILVMESSPDCGGFGLAHAISAVDPYAEWFSLLSRFVHQGALIKASVQTGLLKKIVQLCNEGPRCQTTTIKSGPVPTNDSNMVAIGTPADLDHCLYIHSLSILRTLLVVTAASERAFPYHDIGLKASHSLSQSVTRVLSPFINVLSVGAKEGIAVVDERLASLCEEASGTVLCGIKQKGEFEAVIRIMDSIALIETAASNANPSASAITRLRKLVS